jgi:poly(3-hydroxybutyrate) depolymerase
MKLAIVVLLAALLAPLIVFLHGSGRNGPLRVDTWKDVARKDGIMRAGPDSVTSQGWDTIAVPGRRLRGAVPLGSANAV